MLARVVEMVGHVATVDVSSHVAVAPKSNTSAACMGLPQLRFPTFANMGCLL
jgi:hypothetical protein